MCTGTPTKYEFMKIDRNSEWPPQPCARNITDFSVALNVLETSSKTSTPTSFLRQRLFHEDLLKQRLFK